MIVVTGAAGRLGRRVVRLLLDREIEVLATDQVAAEQWCGKVAHACIVDHGHYQLGAGELRGQFVGGHNVATGGDAAKDTLLANRRAMTMDSWDDTVTTPST